jgi:hypothetical protein
LLVLEYKSAVLVLCKFVVIKTSPLNEFGDGSNAAVQLTAGSHWSSWLLEANYS